MCKTITRAFNCAVKEVPTARHLVTEAVKRWAVPVPDPARAVWEDLELVVGELAGNAARFCRGEFRVRVEAHSDHILVDVVDDGPSTEALYLAPTAPPLDAESGRGLLMVSDLASAWGVERTSASQRSRSGTRVWARLSFPAVSPHLAADCVATVAR